MEDFIEPNRLNSATSTGGKSCANLKNSNCEQTPSLNSNLNEGPMDSTLTLPLSLPETEILPEKIATIVDDALAPAPVPVNASGSKAKVSSESERDTDALNLVSSLLDLHLYLAEEEVALGLGEETDEEEEELQRSRSEVTLQLDPEQDEIVDLDEDEGIIIKADLDERQYKAFKLNNQMKVLLVSDARAKRCAAALSVQAGSLMDPATLPGLAHLCEVILLSSSERHPEENSFETKLKLYGGHKVSSTKPNSTSFAFQIPPPGFYLALRQFASYFISPLFTETGIEQGIDKINSQFEATLCNDEERRQRVNASLMKADHPYSQFECGNTRTLWTVPRSNSIDVQKEVTEFFEKHYSATLMGLVVLGTQSLEELERAVHRIFNDIQESEIDLTIEYPMLYSSPIGPQERMTRIDLVPIRDVIKLQLVFPVPDYSAHYKAGIIPYVNYVMNHEGSGSLISLLREGNWAVSLSSEYKKPWREFAFFTIDLNLTQSGLKNVNNIIHNVFQYIKLLRLEGPQKWLWEDIKVVTWAKFQFLEKQGPLEYVQNLASTITDFPSHHCVAGNYIVRDYMPKTIREFLSHLVPANLRFIVSAKSCVTDEREEWFGANYSYSKIDTDHIQKWERCGLHDDLDFPKENPFIPIDFKLKSRDAKSRSGIPRIIQETDISRVWYLQDCSFKTPKATIMLAILSPLPTQEAELFNETRLLEKIINDNLVETASDGRQSGLTHKVEATLTGLTIMVHGYDSKLHLFFDNFLHSLFYLTVMGRSTGMRFEDIRDEYIQDLGHWKEEQPYVHALGYLRELLNSHAWSPSNLYQAIQSTHELTPLRFTAFVRKFLSTVKLQWFFHGNFTEKDALRMYRSGIKYFQVLETVPIPSSDPVGTREAILKSDTTTVYNAEQSTHTESCCLILLQTGQEDIRETVLTELIHRILKPLAIENFQTSIDPVIWLDVRKSRATLALQIFLQDERDPNTLDHIIEEFLQEMEEKIEGMDSKAFTEHKEGLRDLKMEKTKCLKSVSFLLFEEIIHETYNFRRHELELKELNKLSLVDVMEFYQSRISPDGPERKKLSVLVTSSIEKDEEALGQGGIKYEEPKPGLAVTPPPPGGGMMDLKTTKSTTTNPLELSSPDITRETKDSTLSVETKSKQSSFFKPNLYSISITNDPAIAAALSPTNAKEGVSPAVLFSAALAKPFIPPSLLKVLSNPNDKESHPYPAPSTATANNATAAKSKSAGISNLNSSVTPPLQPIPNNTKAAISSAVIPKGDESQSGGVAVKSNSTAPLLSKGITQKIPPKVSSPAFPSTIGQGRQNQNLNSLPKTESSSPTKTSANNNTNRHKRAPTPPPWSDSWNSKSIARMQSEGNPRIRPASSGNGNDIPKKVNLNLRSSSANNANNNKNMGILVTGSITKNNETLTERKKSKSEIQTMTHLAELRNRIKKREGGATMNRGKGGGSRQPTTLRLTDAPWIIRQKKTAPVSGNPNAQSQSSAQAHAQAQISKQKANEIMVDIRENDFDFDEEIRRLKNLKKYIEYETALKVYNQEMIKSKRQVHVVQSSEGQGQGHGQNPGPLPVFTITEDSALVVDHEIRSHITPPTRPDLAPSFDFQIEVRRLKNLKQTLDEEAQRVAQGIPLFDDSDLAAVRSANRLRHPIALFANAHSKGKGKGNSSGGKFSALDAFHNPNFTAHDVEKEIRRLKNIKRYITGEARELNLKNVDFAVFVVTEIKLDQKMSMKSLQNKLEAKKLEYLQYPNEDKVDQGTSTGGSAINGTLIWKPATYVGAAQNSNLTEKQKNRQSHTQINLKNGKQTQNERAQSSTVQSVASGKRKAGPSNISRTELRQPPQNHVPGQTQGPSKKIFNPVASEQMPQKSERNKSGIGSLATRTAHRHMIPTNQNTSEPKSSAQAPSGAKDKIQNKGWDFNPNVAQNYYFGPSKDSNSSRSLKKVTQDRHWPAIPSTAGLSNSVGAQPTVSATQWLSQSPTVTKIAASGAKVQSFGFGGATGSGIGIGSPFFIQPNSKRGAKSMRTNSNYFASPIETQAPSPVPFIPLVSPNEKEIKIANKFRVIKLNEDITHGGPVSVVTRNGMPKPRPSLSLRQPQANHSSFSKPGTGLYNNGAIWDFALKKVANDNNSRQTLLRKFNEDGSLNNGRQPFTTSPWRVNSNSRPSPPNLVLSTSHLSKPSPININPSNLNNSTSKPTTTNLNLSASKISKPITANVNLINSQNSRLAVTNVGTSKNLKQIATNLSLTNSQNSKPVFTNINAGISQNLKPIITNGNLANPQNPKPTATNLNLNNLQKPRQTPTYLNLKTSQPAKPATIILNLGTSQESQNLIKRISASLPKAPAPITAPKNKDNFVQNTNPQLFMTVLNNGAKKLKISGSIIMNNLRLPTVTTTVETPGIPVKAKPVGGAKKILKNPAHVQQPRKNLDVETDVTGTSTTIDMFNDAGALSPSQENMDSTPTDFYMPLISEPATQAITREPSNYEGIAQTQAQAPEEADSHKNGALSAKLHEKLADSSGSKSPILLAQSTKGGKIIKSILKFQSTYDPVLSVNRALIDLDIDVPLPSHKKSKTKTAILMIPFSNSSASVLPKPPPAAPTAAAALLADDADPLPGTPDLRNWMKKVCAIEMKHCIKSLSRKKVNRRRTRSHASLLPVMYRPPSVPDANFRKRLVQLSNSETLIEDKLPDAKSVETLDLEIQTSTVKMDVELVRKPERENMGESTNQPKDEVKSTVIPFTGDRDPPQSGPNFSTTEISNEQASQMLVNFLTSKGKGNPAYFQQGSLTGKTPSLNPLTKYVSQSQSWHDMRGQSEEPVPIQLLYPEIRGSESSGAELNDTDTDASYYGTAGSPSPEISTPKPEKVKNVVEDISKWKATVDWRGAPTSPALKLTWSKTKGQQQHQSCQTVSDSVLTKSAYSST